jgi:CheY-like chemotaxis protein
VRRVAEQLGGSVTFESVPGRGTVATLRVRADASAGPARAAGAPSAGARPMILLIDDDPEVRASVGSELEAAGFAVVAADGGEAGLALARARRPDAVLLDVVMPGMDGWAVLRALKADPGLRAIPVVMLTIMENAELGLALGAAAYLRKPAAGPEIASALRRHTWPMPPEVLVVDDDARSREMVARILRRQGVKVREAADGAAALAWLEGNQPPAVMILDLAMPAPDGFAVVERLAADARWRAIPVIVLTAKDLSAREAGALGGHVRRIFQKGRLARGELVRAVQDELRAGRRAG